MYVVTGGAGFIGSNIVKSLNQIGIDEVLVVDDLSKGEKFVNIADLDIADYMDKGDFINAIRNNKDLSKGSRIKAVFHHGACSSTTEQDGKYMMENNYQYSKTLLHYCLNHKVPFLYASSAATYGGQSKQFIEEKECENPLNIYGYSKLLFDRYVQKISPKADTQIVGFRYFNVYGPREQHKGCMASIVFNLNNQILSGESLKLFEGSDGFSNGGQRRDFVSVDDVCKVNLWFADHPDKSGIYNIGTGQSESFQSIAEAVIRFHGIGALEYIPFPDHLKGCYQSFTQANLSKLRSVGYIDAFKSTAEGIHDYLTWLNR